MRYAMIAAVCLLALGGWVYAKTDAPGTEATSKEVKEEEKALAKLAAMQVVYEARMEAAQEKYRRFRGEGKMDDAYKAYLEEQGLIDEVTKKYMEYIQAHPKSAVAYNQLGLFAYDHGRVEEAKSYWERAIELEPDFAAAHNNIATYYGHEGQPKKALEELGKAVELDPNQAVFHLNLATEYYTSRSHAMEMYGWDVKKVFEEILNEHRAARGLEPHNFDYAKQYADTFYAAKYFGVEPDWDEAIRGYERCLQTDLTKDEKAYVYMGIARIYITKGDKAKARQTLEKAKFASESATYKVLWKRAQEEATPAPGKAAAE